MNFPPRYHCERCQDWRMVVAPDGRGTVPCPGDEITGTPCTAPTPNRDRSKEPK